LSSLSFCQLCLPLHRQTYVGGGTTILLRRGTVHHSVPIPALTLLGGHCCSSDVGRQNVENPCGLPLTFSPIARSGRDRLFQRGIASPDGQQSQCQTLGLELAADKETGETPTLLRRQ